MGMSNDPSFLKAARGEAITARARAIHRGRTTWVWEVEITDKGYVNQRAALQRRAGQVDALFAESPGVEVIVCA